MNIITASKWGRPILDEKSVIVKHGNKYYQSFTGATVRDCMAQYRNAQENNDLNLFLPMQIENVENTEE